MKSRAFMSFFIAVIFSLIAFPAPSRAVTFPITYSGLKHETVTIFNGDEPDSFCETDSKLDITLFADGTLSSNWELARLVSSTSPPSCEFLKEGKTLTYKGTHDLQGNFSITDFDDPLTGTYNDDSLTGSMTYVGKFNSSTCTFTLPAPNEPPKITLEPSTYPDFQMNILKKEGFTIRIRKEDGVMDSQGNWKLNWSTVRFETNGVDNSTHFIETAAKLWIFSVNYDSKEVLIKITPDPEKFMTEQNVFNIQWNGEHKIGFQICDTDGRCGKSEYTLYFGPFALLGEIVDKRCIIGEKFAVLNIGSIVIGNMAYASPDTYLYMALVNAHKPEEYWCARVIDLYNDGNFGTVWFEGEVHPFANYNIPGTFSWTQHDLAIFLRSKRLNEEYKQFPAGDYKLLVFVRDISVEALNGDIKDVKTCLYLE